MFKKLALLFTILSIVSIVILTSKPTADEEYVVLSWNDLGMHCSNKDFSKIAILPPYNNLYAQVIKIGSQSKMPEIVTTGIRITYEFPNNTYSVGKTNFWDYEDKLFNVELEDNIGLTGKGLTGEFDLQGDHFVAEGIPLTPYSDNDLENEDPYQQALVKVYDLDGNLLATSMPVAPVSNEIGCVSGGCHSSERDILEEHEDEDGFNPNNTPILCASCHASNALGTSGNSEARSLSYRIHKEHSEKTNDCYKCHPGESTQCFRGVMSMAGKTCTDCHGSMSEVASSIRNGREPWLEEPECNSCHGNDFAPNANTLYRNSKGHGGVFCAGCHGSPHAIYPSTEPKDNQNMIDLQGYAAKLTDCSVCHGMTPNFAGPHGYVPVSVKDEVSASDLKIYPQPATENLYLENIRMDEKIKIFDLKGKLIPITEDKIERANNKIGIFVGDLDKGSYILRTSKLTRIVIKN